MTYPHTFRMFRGKFSHVTHKTNSVKLDRPGYLVAQCGASGKAAPEKSVQTLCGTCTAINDVFALNQNLVRALVWQRDGYVNTMGDSRIKRAALRADIADSTLRLTERGQALSLDFTLGAHPAADEYGVVHDRRPLSRMTRCRLRVLGARLTYFSIDDYIALRATPMVVTCIDCMAFH